ncbi:Mdm33 family-domain-containing protein [Hyaloraphidium curvatum]|nr:Mdm33 family-domain-containing protein [Hyaloraphidium curvatum]
MLPRTLFHLARRPPFARCRRASSWASAEKVNNAINEMTGYSRIEALKARIRTAETAYAAARDALRDSHEALEDAHRRRARAQRDANALLQRRHTWDQNDVQAFTELYAQEHGLAKEVEERGDGYRKAQKGAEDAMVELVEGLRERFWEETSWSDRIRAMSTYATIALMLLNIGIAVWGHGYIEPRRRAAMVDRIGGFVEGAEQRTMAGISASEQEIKDVKTTVGKVKAVLESIIGPEEPPEGGEGGEEGEDLESTWADLALAGAAMLSAVTLAWALGGGG